MYTAFDGGNRPDDDKAETNESKCRRSKIYVSIIME